MHRIADIAAHADFNFFPESRRDTNIVIRIFNKLSKHILKYANGTAEHPWCTIPNPPLEMPPSAGAGRKI
jgi:hypothetical protein